jgi:hypothetical protein
MILDLTKFNIAHVVVATKDSPVISELSNFFKTKVWTLLSVFESGHANIRVGYFLSQPLVSK